MTDTTDQQAVTVAQEDIDAANEIIAIQFDNSHTLYQLEIAGVLARHRLASVSSASAEGGPKSMVNPVIINGVLVGGQYVCPPTPEPVPATNQAGEVEVKPLAWTEPHASHTYPNWYARVYSIKFEARINTGKPLRHGKFPLSINGDMIDKKFETVEDAKAYAQNDYAQRILAALATQPATSQEAPCVDPRGVQCGVCGDWFQHTSAGYCATCIRSFKVPDHALAATPTPPTLSEDLREAAARKVLAEARIAAGSLFGDCPDNVAISAMLTFAALAQVKAS